MKKQIILLLLIINLFSCKDQAETAPENEEKVENIDLEEKGPLEADGWEIKPFIPLEDFISEFEQAVEGHNALQVANSLDLDYKEEQLHNLNGNLDQLINELFCGTDEKGDFLCFDLINIQEINLIKIEDTNNGQFAIFEVFSLNTRILVHQLFIQETVNDDGFIIYSLVGAVG